MAKIIDTPETITDEQDVNVDDAATEPTEAPTRRQYTTVLTDEAVIDDLDVVKLLNKHSTPADLTRAALTAYASANAEKVARFREFMAE